MDEEVEKYVKQYGEENRKSIENVIKYSREKVDSWKNGDSNFKDRYIRDFMQRVK